MTEPENVRSGCVAGAPLVIITGLSGAGKSTAMKFLEDLGCYCLDNLPPALILDFFNLYQRSSATGPGVVIACDVRSGALFDDFVDMVNSLRESGVEFEVLYLDSDTDTLIRRFKEVRRNHPLQVRYSMEEAIEEERRRLEPIRDIATRIVDTSRLDAATLRAVLLKDVVSADATEVMHLDFLSFGFKYGIPREADFVFDVRMLPNPFYVPELKGQTGLDDDVFEYVLSFPLADTYLEKVIELIELTLEPFLEVGKTGLTIGIGCTGGHHRSVALARRLADDFQARGRKTRAVHRDISRPQG